jgi:hypothetical protein
MFEWLRRLREAARRDAEAERRPMKPDGQSERPARPGSNRGARARRWR